MTIRIACLLILVAGPAVAQPLPGRTMPVPPIPPAAPPAADLAPRPNPDILPPVAGPDGVRVRPEVFSAARPDTSMGFAPGSRYQSSDERSLWQTPGLRMTVPLR